MLHDLSNMPEEQRKKEYLARLETNLCFIMADVMECLFLECEEINRECGYQLRHDSKRQYNAMMHNLKLLRGETKHLDENDQIEFGNDADITCDILYAVVSRTGTDNMMLLRFLEYAMSFPDKLGLDSVRKGSDAFEAIKKKLKIQ